MSESPTSHPRPHRETIKKLLAAKGLSKAVENIGDFLKAIRTTTERWQEEDWNDREHDEDYLLNSVRIVGQVWFRGQRNCDHGLIPGLYRLKTRNNLRKQPGSPVPVDEEANRFDELFDLNTSCGLTSPVTGIF